MQTARRGGGVILAAVGVVEQHRDLLAIRGDRSGELGRVRSRLDLRRTRQASQFPQPGFGVWIQSFMAGAAQGDQVLLSCRPVSTPGQDVVNVQFDVNVGGASGSAPAVVRCPAGAASWRIPPCP